MRLVALTDPGREIGIVVGDGRAVPAAVLGQPVPQTFDELAASGIRGLDALREAFVHGDGVPPVAFDPARLPPPIGRVGKIVAVGRNYAEHAAEEGAVIHDEPLLFAKWTSSIIGHGAEIRWGNAQSRQVDWEAELAVVIAEQARNVAPADAVRHVLGYTCLNDVSARDLQFADGQWTRAKSLDSFCPLGPCLVTPDELPDVQQLSIRCQVNGEAMQSASTAQMVHGVAELISYISRYASLEPGDIIATGTPSGVGVFRDPPRYLRDGDTVEVIVDGVGVLRNVCRVVPDPGEGVR